MADIETAKRNAARRAVTDHFDPAAKYVGIGSGSTIVYVVEAIQALKDERISQIHFVPTGYQSRQVIINAGLKDIKFDSLPKNTLIDIAFDGADEVDEELNCIKGGGACLYQEKLVATHARKFICVAGTLLIFPSHPPFFHPYAKTNFSTPPPIQDHRKLQPRLLSKWPTIPIEVEPLAAPTILAQLSILGSPTSSIREGPIAKSGPIKTDQDNYIVDAPFHTLLLPSDVARSQSLHPTHKGVGGRGEQGKWEVETLAREIKLIEGVLSVGLFVGVNGVQAESAGKGRGGQKPVAAYFGMEDGSVVIRNAKELGGDREQKVSASEI